MTPLSLKAVALVPAPDLQGLVGRRKGWERGNPTWKPGFQEPPVSLYCCLNQQLAIGDSYEDLTPLLELQMYSNIWEFAPLGAHDKSSSTGAGNR